MLKISQSKIQHNLDKYINHLDLPLATEQLIRYLNYNLIDLDDFTIHTEIGKHTANRLEFNREKPLTLIRLYKAMDTYHIPFQYFTSKYQEPPRVTKIFSVGYYRVAHFYQFNSQEAMQLVATTIDKLFNGVQRRFAEYMGFNPDSFVTSFKSQRVSKLHFLTMVLGLDLAHNHQLLEYLSKIALGKTLEQLDKPSVTYLDPQTLSQIQAQDQAKQAQQEKRLAQVRDLVHQQKLAQFQLLQQLATETASVQEAHNTPTTSLAKNYTQATSQRSDSATNNSNDYVVFGSIDQQQQEYLAFAPSVVTQILDANGQMHTATSNVAYINTNLTTQVTHTTNHCEKVTPHSTQLADLTHFQQIHQDSNTNLHHQSALDHSESQHELTSSTKLSIPKYPKIEDYTNSHATQITTPEKELPNITSYLEHTPTKKSYLTTTTHQTNTNNTKSNFFSGVNFAPEVVQEDTEELITDYYSVLDEKDETDHIVVAITNTIDHLDPIYLTTNTPQETGINHSDDIPTELVTQLDQALLNNPVTVTLAQNFITNIQPINGTSTQDYTTLLPTTSQPSLAQMLAQQISKQPQDLNRSFYNTQLDLVETTTIQQMQALVQLVKNQQVILYAITDTSYQPYFNLGDTIVCNLNQRLTSQSMCLYVDITDQFSRKKLAYLQQINDEQVLITSINNSHEPYTLYNYQIRIIGSHVFTVGKSI